MNPEGVEAERLAAAAPNMRYCRTCVIPHTRPNIRFDADGACNCPGRDGKDAIDWVERSRQFDAVVAEVKGSGRGYNCLVPVSGGKDSMWQVVTCLEAGLNVLAVTWRPPGRTPLGQFNLERLRDLGVDHIDYAINPAVERTFTYMALKRLGAPALPMHMAIFSIPLQVAVGFDIPLVVWGENSAFEYGGEEQTRHHYRLDRNWLKTHGVTHGTTARDWVGTNLSVKDLTPYFAPTDEELEARGIRAVFLGHYFRWDPETSLAVATAHGFQRRAEGAHTGFYDYADIDDTFISVHHWLKWYKFGFTRLYDNLSLEIRNGRITRDEAIEIIRRRGDETPHEDIEQFCDWLGITVEHFYEVVEPFRNRDIWNQREDTWVIDDFLIPDWEWI